MASTKPSLSKSSGRQPSTENRTAGNFCAAKPARAVVVEQQDRLAIIDFPIRHVDLLVQVPGCDQQIERAGVVEIDEFYTQRTEGPARRANPEETVASL